MVRQRLLLRIRGSLFSTEQWSVNPQFIGNFTEAAPSEADLTQWCAAVSQLLAGGAYGGILAALSSAGTIDGVDAYYYGADGKLAAQGTFSRGTPINGTGSPNMPAASAIVASLNTSVPGRRSRGRIYWPALGLSIATAGGGISPSTASAIAAQTASLLAAAEDGYTGPNPIVAAVYSQANGEGYAVTSVRVGDQIDSQRRRRESLVEHYSSAPMPT